MLEVRWWNGGGEYDERYSIVERKVRLGVDIGHDLGIYLAASLKEGKDP